MSPFGLLLLQIIVILGFAKSLAPMLRWLGQPAVVVEILAGVILGPSLLGALCPSVSAALFPPRSLPSLALISQLGLVLYLFVVGMRLDTSIMRQRTRSVAATSLASIVIPAVGGLALGLVLVQRSAGTLTLLFALFLGTAMSVTAFPVLARIISERGMTGTPIANLALTCAAIGDVVAWCLLAFTVAISTHGSLLGAAGTLAGAAVFTLAMLTLVRPLLGWALMRHWPGCRASKTWMAAVIVYLLLAAWLSEAIGVHALYGAFIAGLAMPADAEARSTICERLEYVSESVLLPLFFALSGLRTRIGALDQAQLWLACALIVLVAVACKFAAGAVARLGGWSWRESLTLGALLNTRGLIELIVLNIGYDLGILSPAWFTILVIMALVTTCLTGPLLRWLLPR
jgi:Kef-type K+ transport system membrane component KefB